MFGIETNREVFTNTKGNPEDLNKQMYQGGTRNL